MTAVLLGVAEHARTRLRGRGTMELPVAVAALAVFTWQIETPSPWRDEGVTLDVSGRSVADILRLTSHVDRVHLVYYLIAHSALELGHTLAIIRVISALAATGTAVLLTLIGRELGSPALGVTAAGVFIASPLASRFAQDARSYALVTMAGTLATLLWIIALTRPTRRIWVGYVAASLFAVALNVLAGTLLISHVLFALTMPSRARRDWRIAAATVGAGALLILAAILGQRGQVSYLMSPTPGELLAFLRAQQQPWLLVLVTIMGAGAYAAVARKPWRPLALGLLWGVVPAAVLWTAAHHYPVFGWRYAAFTMPGLALAIASPVAMFRRAELMGSALVVTLALGGLPGQADYRDPSLGHSEDVRGAAQVIADRAVPGDVVLFVPNTFRIIEQTFPERFVGTIDPMLAQSPSQSATFTGVELPPDRVPEALATATRVWVITGEQGLRFSGSATDAAKVAVLERDFAPQPSVPAATFLVTLYTRIAQSG